MFRQRSAFVALLDRAGVVIEVNDAPGRRGFEREQFVGRHIADTPYFAADSSWRRTWQTRLAEVADTVGPVGYDDTTTTTSGEVRYAEAIVSPILDDGGRLECFLVEAEDTTEQLQVELALREGERRYHDLLVELPAPAWGIDADGECDFVNQRWLEEFGTLPRRADRTDWAAVIHPDDRSEFELAWVQAQASAVALSARCRLVDVLGAVRNFELRLAPVLGDDGIVARWSGVALELGDEPTPRS